jgi:hypothetical protein
MIQGLAPLLGRHDGDAQVVFDLGLAHEVVQALGAQRSIEGNILFLLLARGDPLGHVQCREILADPWRIISREW